MGCSPSSQKTQYIHAQVNAISAFIEAAVSTDHNHSVEDYNSLTARIDPDIIKHMDAAADPRPYLQDLFQRWGPYIQSPTIRARMANTLLLADQLQQRVTSNNQAMTDLMDKTDRLFMRSVIAWLLLVTLC